MSNPLTGVEGDLSTFLADVRARFDRVEAESLPVIHDGALALEGSAARRRVSGAPAAGGLRSSPEAVGHLFLL